MRDAARRVRKETAVFPAAHGASFATKASARMMMASSTSSFRTIGRSRSDSLTAAAKAHTRILVRWVRSIDNGSIDRFDSEVAGVFMAMH